jgi:hypothetical protein
MKLEELSDLLRELQALEHELEGCRSNTRIRELSKAISILRDIDIAPTPLTVEKIAIALWKSRGLPDTEDISEMAGFYDAIRKDAEAVLALLEKSR